MTPPRLCNFCSRPALPRRVLIGGSRTFICGSCFTRKTARYACKDCGVNVIEAGEYYMVSEALWKKLRLTWQDNLCIGCLEARLGRKLRNSRGGRVGDFITWPENPGGFATSKRYLDRLTAKTARRKRKSR